MLRIIPKLDIKGPNLVKGVHLEGLRVLGKPEKFARYYYQQGADELIYMDVVASLYGRNSLHEIVRRTASEIFIPLTVGGGLRSVEDIRTVLCAGADKVSLNTAAVLQPALISEAANRFGSSTIVVSIEAKAQSDGSYEAYTDNGRVPTGREVFSWAREVEELGAGEILLTSIDCEGTGRGLDEFLVKQVATTASIPVIACGGSGHAEQVAASLVATRADAVAIGSMLHYEAIEQYDPAGDDFSTEGNVEFLMNRSRSRLIEPTCIREIKACLDRTGITTCNHREEGV